MQLLLRVYSGVRRKFHGAFIQWHMVAVCIWCALFVTSQFDVIFMFQTNVLAKFVDTYAYSSTRTLLILCVIALNINYQRSKGVKHTHHYGRASYNCKIRLC